MIKLFSTQKLNSSKSKDKLPLQCEHCKETFYLKKQAILRAINPNNHNSGKFCSLKCKAIFQNPPVYVSCLQCGVNFKKLPNEIKRNKNHFCSRSCNATYQNLHKTKGTRRSKLEIWLESQLDPLYPKLKFRYNRKDAINSELDIYIPMLSLAFEINGIFHYEPIFGLEKLAQIKNNDKRKYQACIEAEIELCLIDASTLKYFKPTNAQKYLDIITSIIDTKYSDVLHELSTS